MAIELVVFDIAGTTVDDGDAVNRSFRAALARAGLAVSHAAANSVMGLPKPEAIRILLEQFGRPCGVLPTAENIDAIHKDFSTHMCGYYATDPGVREIPGAAG